MSRRVSPWFVGTIAAWVGYAVVWTQISLGRLYLLRSSVFDLGLYAEFGWRTYSASLSPGAWLGAALNFGGPIFLSPTTLGGYPTILAAQSCALGSGAVLVYLVARHYENRPPVAFGLAAAYLLYFPLSGINFTDAHYEAYLIPFFLLGVWLCLRGNFVLSFVLLSLAGAIQFPLAIFPFLFGIQLLLPEVSESIARRMQPTGPNVRSHRSMVSLLQVFAGWKFTRSRSPVPKWYIFGLPLTAAALLVGAWLTSDLYISSYTASNIVHATSVGILPNLSVKFWSLFLLLAPLAFVPLLSPRWLPFCVPFFGLMFYVNYWGYTYPYIATSWYAFLVVPFLFLATIDGVAKIREGSTWVHGLRRRLRGWMLSIHSSGKTPQVAAGSSSSQERRGVRWQGFGGHPTRASALSVCAVVILTMVSAGFLTPYGPWNSSNEASFGFPVFGPYNQTLYDELLKLASLVPPSDPSVILQDNMPEVLPRATLSNSPHLLVAGPFGSVAYNLTWHAPNGSWAPIDPDYVIGDPYPTEFSFFDAKGTYPYNISMEQILTELYATYDYGIVGEASGMLLLKHFYSGPLLYYAPLSEGFSPAEFRSDVGVSDSTICRASCLVATDQVDQQIAWYGPDAFLSPGEYSVSFHLGVANWEPRDSAVIETTGDHGVLGLNSTTLSGLTVGPEMSSIYRNMTVFVGGATSGIEFRAVDSSFNGSLALYGVEVREIAPPSSVYRVGDTIHDAALYRLLGLVPSGSTVLAESALQPYFHNVSLVTVPATGPIPPAQYELFDPTIWSSCVVGINNSLCAVVNQSYTSGTYSIVGEVDGVTLLAPSPATLASFAPYNETIPTSTLLWKGGTGQSFTSWSDGNLTVTNQTNGGYGWWGPYASLPPGAYEVRLNLSVTNTSRSNQLLLAVTTGYGKISLGGLWLNGTAFVGPNEVTTVTLPFMLSTFSSSIEFVGKEVSWPGTITLSGIELVETGPPA